MDRLVGDLTSGVRMLVRYPTLSLGAILTLGVGIGLSTTVFCVVNAGLFKGLPFPNADRIVSVYSSNVAQRQPRMPIAVHDLAVFQSRQTSFEAIGAYARRHTTSLSRRDAPSGFRADSCPWRRSRRSACSRSSVADSRRATTSRERATSSCSGTSCGATATGAHPISSAGRFAPTASS